MIKATLECPESLLLEVANDRLASCLERGGGGIFEGVGGGGGIE